MEEIVAERQPKGRKTQVLVKWQGFDILDATWEPLTNMPPLVVEAWRDLLQQQERGMADEDDDDDSE